MVKIRLKKLLNAHILCCHLALYLKKLLIKSYQKLFFFFGANHFYLLKIFKKILARVKDRKMSAFWIFYRQILSIFLFIIKI